MSENWWDKYNPKKYSLPVDYDTLEQYQRREVREQYILEQDNKCFYCGETLSENVPQRISDMVINWSLFPKNFLKYHIHLQHDHETGMTEGAVHNYCNAVLWQYENR